LTSSENAADDSKTAKQHESPEHFDDDNDDDMCDDEDDNDNDDEYDTFDTVDHSKKDLNRLDVSCRYTAKSKVHTN
jgi:hypothetical protein